MPIYMDRHDIPGVTAEAVASAHQEDLKIQHKYDCKGLTYWFDEDKGIAFCLVEAPDKDSVKRLHDHAHGLIPHQIIEVERELVESFLGRIEDPEPTDTNSNANYLVINDPAFRSIMAIDLNDTISTSADMKPDGTSGKLEVFKKILSEELKQHNGRKVEHMEEVCMASFDSVNQSVQCALAIKHRIQAYNEDHTGNIYVRIGLSAGLPVTGEDDLFGPVVRFAKRLCTICGSADIIADSSINDLYNHKLFNTEETDQSISFLNPDDERFIGELMDLLELKWSAPMFRAEKIPDLLGMSKSQLYRKITSLTGLAPGNFIKEYRLINAKQAIEKQQGNISAIAYECGFSSLSYFTKSFLKRFGMTPSKYANIVS